MPTRSGSLGGGLNPFGTGSLSNLGQYDIGTSVADWAAYEVEVRWGNGQATDAEYLAALTTARDKTAVGTRERAEKQNKLDDVVYRIDRSKAEAVGLDALIAFDQRALSAMNPSNQRYRDVKDSLDSELAQRRSRDYGKMVDDYNAGHLTTDALLGWVNSTVGGLPADAPDRDNWLGVQTDLHERKLDEQDAKMYQDYQMRRIKPAEFLTYLAGRAAAYDPSSPKGQEWARKLEDATKNVRETEQARKDTAFFNAYEEGHKSDAAYLKYIRDRIAHMDPGDPDLPTWQHRLNQAAFSLAEDKLRFDVQRGKAPVSKLISFYKNYRRTLNPGSAEYRTITRALMSLGSGGGSGGGGGGGGGGGRGGSAAKGGKSSSGVKVDAKDPYAQAFDKLIDPKNEIKGASLSKFLVDPRAAVSDKRRKALAANISSARHAAESGDAVWLFIDPTKPGQKIPEQAPDGSYTGRMIEGSAYLPASHNVLSALLDIDSQNDLASYYYALANKDSAKAIMYLGRSNNAKHESRVAQATYVAQNDQDLIDAKAKQIKVLIAQGDYAGAQALAADLVDTVGPDVLNSYLPDDRRNQLQRALDEVTDNPLFPRVDPVTGEYIEGALNQQALKNGETVLNPGWHAVLQAGPDGMPDYTVKYDDGDPDAWAANHVTVHTTYAGVVTQGDVVKDSAQATSIVYLPDGQKIGLVGDALHLGYPDENGRTVHAYSIDDGATWISPGYGMPKPTVVLEGAGPVQHVSGPEGEAYLDTDGNPVLVNDGTGWTIDAGYKGQAKWYGQTAWERSKGAANTVAGTNAGPDDRARAQPGASSGSFRGFMPSGSSQAIEIGTTRIERESAKLDVGGPGMHMTLAPTQANGDGSRGPVNLAKPYTISQSPSANASARAYVTAAGASVAKISPILKPIAGLASSIAAPQPPPSLPPTPQGYEGTSVGSLPPPILPKINPSTGFTITPAKTTAPPKIKTTADATAAKMKAASAADAARKKAAAAEAARKKAAADKAKAASLADAARQKAAAAALKTVPKPTARAGGLTVR